MKTVYVIDNTDEPTALWRQTGNESAEVFVLGLDGWDESSDYKGMSLSEPDKTRFNDRYLYIDDALPDRRFITKREAKALFPNAFK